MDLRQRKENSVKGGDESGAIVRENWKVIRRRYRRVVNHRRQRRGVSSDDRIQGMIFPRSWEGYMLSEISGVKCRKKLLNLRIGRIVKMKIETQVIRFGVSDYVREVTSPDKVGSDPMNGRDATWGQLIRVL